MNLALNGRGGMRTSPTLWIVHRDAQQRAALARIARAGDSTFMGSPSDELFASATPANVVLLAPSEDFESELEFVNRFSPGLPDCTWIVLPTAGDLSEAKRLFDSIPATFLTFPPQPDRLRGAIAKAGRHRSVDSLSRRKGHELLTARFARWFIDLDMPDLLRALDPRLGHIPLLIRGEVGTGRSVVARYVHAFGGADDAELIHVPCAGLATERELIDFIGQAASHRTGHWRRTIWLEDVDHLPASVQLRVRDWIEFGLPEASLRTTNVRFIASAREPDDDEFELDILDRYEGEDGPAPAKLHAGLENALSGHVIALPPLRERAAAIEEFVFDTALSWAASLGEPQRSFGAEALRELVSYPWPGNMTQLESVVIRSLSHSSADPLEVHHLRFQVESPASTEAMLPEAEFVDEESEQVEAEVASTTPESVLPEDVASQPNPTEPQLDDQLPPIETPAAPSPPPGGQPPAPDFDEGSLRRLVGALAHEVRNPLVSIRTFSELLPEHYADEDFRHRFAELVGADVRQIESVVSRLQDLAQLSPARREPIDLSAMLERILAEHERLTQDRHLLILKELDRTQPFVLADGEQLERALVGLFETALSMVPERGDVYLASKHQAQGFSGSPTVRVLLRYHIPSLGRPLGDLLGDDNFRIEGVSPTETALEFLIAEAIVKAQGGAMTLDTTDGQETVIVIDLPAPPQP